MTKGNDTDPQDDRQRGGPVLRPHAEQEYAQELEALARADDHPRPPQWRLSPWAVVAYVLGGVLADGTTITPKYIGPRRVVEVAVATLATDRALLLLGLPGTAKTWMSEHLAAAISGESVLLVQGTAGTPEEALRYGWNYARLLTEGPTEQALVPSPVLRAMRDGALVRIEELTRIPSDVQDALITILSEKSLPIPELGTEVQAAPGFNVIATANDRDRGVNELSSVLRRRFNTVLLPLPASADDEVAIVGRRVADIGRALELPELPSADAEIRRVVTVFRELRSGVTDDGRISLKTPTATLSPAEAISVVTNGWSLAAHFGDGELHPSDLADSIVGAVVKDPVHDSVAWREYVEGVLRDRPGWADFYRACRETLAMPSAAEVRILGIRHHGPGSARSTLEALDGFRPDVVCIEGPPEAEAIAHLAADAAMTPPVALLAYDLEQPSTASFWPLASFSPEWQALRWAQRHGSAVRFVDLPAAHVLAAGTGERRAAKEQADPLAGLAAAAGYDDVERWWDDLVEHSEREVFAALGEAMAAVRETAPTVPAEGLDHRREAHMRHRVRATLAEGADRVAVVCGAWHGPALRDLSAVPAEADVALLQGLPSVKVAMTWVPWSSRRLAAATGYGAGVRAPGWYHHLFTHAGPDVVARWFCEVAAVLRVGGYTVSPAQLIDATRLADALATMRRRTLPGLSEVTDAAAAVLGEGGSAPMALVHDDLIVGTTVGSVPADTPMVPLARDLAAWQRRLRLKPEDRTLELDLRRPGGLARSHLLHRLALLDVPWGIPLEGRGAAGTFRETWKLRWEPELSVGLVERSAFGTTVEAATAAYVAHVAGGEVGLADLTRLVEGCLLADLPAALSAVMRVLADRAAVHAEVAQLMDALGPLARARRYGDVRGTDVAALDTVLRGLVVRITSGLGRACIGLDAEEAAAMGQRLQATQAALALLAASDHTAELLPSWFRALSGLLGAPTVPGLVRGRASRLLLDAEQLDASGAGRLLGRALTAGTPAQEGAAFVEGFLAGSGTVLVHDRALLGLVDSWVADLPIDAFSDALPLLRRTFATFEPSERRLIGELVRRGGVDAPGETALADGLDEERVRAALATMADLLGVDQGDGP